MAEADDRPGYSFTPGPPPEASRFLANKGWQPAFSWADVEPEEHAVAFTVAKATSMDVLRTIREELQTALDDGLPFSEFQRRLRPRLQTLGWWGYGEAVDGPRGAKPALLGTPRRLRTIYDANLRSARAAGQWERIERTKGALPYLTYRLGPSERHRPHHESKEGLTLPVDDPFWDSWMPPNGWGCKCWVRQVTRSEAESIGISESPEVPDRTWTNPRTGEVQQIPQGIDPGWQRNPGKRRVDAMERLLTDRLEVAHPAIQAVAMRDLATSWRVRRILTEGASGTAPVAMLPGALTDALGARTRIALVSSDTAEKQLRQHAELGPLDYARLSELILSGRVRKKGTSLLFIGRDRDLPWVAAIKATRDRQELYLTTLFRAASARYVERRLAEGEVIRD